MQVSKLSPSPSVQYLAANRAVRASQSNPNKSLPDVLMARNSQVCGSRKCTPAHHRGADARLVTPQNNAAA